MAGGDNASALVLLSTLSFLDEALTAYFCRLPGSGDAAAPLALVRMEMAPAPRFEQGPFLTRHRHTGRRRAPAAAGIRQTLSPGGAARAGRFGFRPGNQTLTLCLLARELANAAHRFRFLAHPPFRWLLI
jgi:hypothetical protein